MDYFDLLNKAQKISRQEANKDVPCFATSLAPPKKIARSSVPTANIQRFLAKKQEEEKKKQLEAKKKKDELLALRALDKKSQKRMQIMLKTTKSANKSVMEDAIDNVNTAHTLNGPQQCDEDDYGYVSQEASAFYEKLMNKYQNTPAEESKTMKREAKDLSAAKDRVKAALRREEEEELMPRKRKRKLKEDVSENKEESEEEEEEPPKPIIKEEKKKINKNAPPPVDFFQLMKIAEQKQYEPIIIEKKIEKGPERPMTMKEKLEHQREMESKMRRSKSSNSDSKRQEAPKPGNKSEINTPTLGKIPKKSKPDHDVNCSSSNKKTEESQLKKSVNSSREYEKKMVKKEGESRIEEKSQKLFGGDPKKKGDTQSPKLSNGKRYQDQSKGKDYSKTTVNPTSSSKSHSDTQKIQELSDIDREIQMLMQKKAMMMKQAKAKEQCPQNAVPSGVNESKLREALKSNELRRSDTKLSERRRLGTSGPSDQRKCHPPRMDEPKLPASPNTGNFRKEGLQKSNERNMSDSGSPHMKKPPTESYDPALRFPMKKKPLPGKKPVGKRRVIDSESEYDSDLDDFIDDGPLDEMDYSTHIREIFGYDKSRYAEIDEDECEESSFGRQMREETRSAKIGLLEDLEDIRREKEEKERIMERKKMKMKR